MSAMKENFFQHQLRFGKLFKVTLRLLCQVENLVDKSVIRNPFKQTSQQALSEAKSNPSLISILAVKLIQLINSFNTTSSFKFFVNSFIVCRLNPIICLLDKRQKVRFDAKPSISDRALQMAV